MTKDLTSGNPFKIILLFTLPLMLGNLFQQFYSLADTIIVGRFVGVNALAAVGATGSVNYLILGFVIGMCSGTLSPSHSCLVPMMTVTCAAMWPMQPGCALPGCWAYRCHGGADPPHYGADADPGGHY